MKKRFSGINIQFPISRLIISGEKTVETRTYPLPEKFVGKELLVIETPGESGNFKARVIGKIVFGPSFKYETAKDFYADEKRHRVDKNSKWKWQTGKNKWGWPILRFTRLIEEVPAPKAKGIRFTRDIEL